jgi:hypothetical protein
MANLTMYRIKFSKVTSRVPSVTNTAYKTNKIVRNSTKPEEIIIQHSLSYTNETNMLLTEASGIQ